MKYLLTSLAILSSVCFAYAQNDPQAKKILDAVSAKFKTYPTPQASFSYKVENAAGKALSSKNGNVVMKGAKYKVVMSGMEIYCDGKTTWNYDASANEVTIDNVNPSGTAMTPQKLFTNFYDKDFVYKLNGEKKQGAKTLQEIELSPTDKSRPFFKVYLYIDKMATAIYSARFLEKSGGRYTYTVNSLQPKAAVSDGDFTFNKAKHPKAEVVDLR